MYCIKCGVKLADTEKSCPLCQTRVYHPDIEQPIVEPLYPPDRYPESKVRSFIAQILLSAVVLLAIVTVLMSDFQLFKEVTWSGYVVGALAVGYIGIILPMWFKSPNPVIFVPCWFAAVEVYLLYINYQTDGNWFLSFAFPVVGGVAAIVTTVVTLVKYVKRGKLYIFGGALIALGAFMLLVEFLAKITFDIPRFTGWSFYPMNTLMLLGGVLIFFAVYRPARELMERKFFI